MDLCRGGHRFAWRCEPSPSGLYHRPKTSPPMLRTLHTHASTPFSLGCFLATSTTFGRKLLRSSCALLASACLSVLFLRCSSRLAIFLTATVISSSPLVSRFYTWGSGAFWCSRYQCAICSKVESRGLPKKWGPVAHSLASTPIQSISGTPADCGFPCF